MNESIERLARLKGIGDAYHDYRGELQYFSLETKRALLSAMGYAAGEADELASELRHCEVDQERRFLPPLILGSGGRLGIDVNVSAREFGATLLWTLRLEDGGLLEGAISSADCDEVWRGEVDGAWITRRRLELPAELPLGYHALEAKIAGAAPSRCLIIMAPPRCFDPPALLRGERLWGMAVQLYTLRSRENWGIGDFADLKTLVRWLAPQGAAFVGVNPLHALLPADPRRSSPYSASSRHFLNVLYIAVPATPEFDECAALNERRAQADFAEALARVREGELVGYAAVAALKLECLAMLYQDFRERHLKHGTARARSFERFCTERGAALEAHALFDALDAHCRAVHGTSSGWMNWPEEFRDVHGAAAQRFAAAHRAQVEFYAYLQWLAHEQLSDVQALARELGMPIGLYGDYAVGASPGGSETWSDPSDYRLGAEIGAPPDPLALKGQGWGIPPQDPSRLREQGYHGFATLLRNNMRYYGALRLDHVMALFRLWWVPAGHSPTDGAYVHYRLEERLAVLALESVRASCLVVGEDLGVVPDEMRRAMPAHGLYHYKVLIFEKHDGRFRRPEEFEVHALATATTHDMPTLRSYWEGRDIDLRSSLKLYPDASLEEEIRRERNRDREALLAALEAEGLKPEHLSATGPFTPALAHAMHVYLARSPTTLVAVQLEDLLGMVEPVNIPGTDQEYPNWQRKLSAELEDLAAREDLAQQFAELRAARAAR